MDKKFQKIKLALLALGLVTVLSACQKKEEEPYVSKREGKVVETAFNAMTEAEKEAQTEVPLAAETERPVTQTEAPAATATETERETLTERLQTEAETEGTQPATVRADTLNVRSMPSTNGEVITKLAKGTQVTILSTQTVGNATWAYIRAQEIAGYVDLRYLER